MGKHSKEVDCSVCNGEGETVVSFDGRTETVPCPACDGTGKQP